MYAILEHRAVADVVDGRDLGLCAGPSGIITRINVPPKARGLGFGSRLLREILHDADAEGVTLILEINPSGDLNFAQLEAWYMRYDFVAISEGYYQRRPQGAK
ncbi:MAG: GNAT family N-acetyltransferase [Xanthomonadales bacterium]|nr:GNAT family N-acetyltransferase [Xanthomonadales bacterium]